jgi:Putative 2/3 transmembrane domain holin
MKSCSRMSCWLIVSVLLMGAVFFLVPSQIAVITNKILLVTISAWIGYWFSVSAFPYARPGHLLFLLNHTETEGPPPNEWELLMGRLAVASMICRAVIMGMTMVAVALGL